MACSLMAVTVRSAVDAWTTGSVLTWHSFSFKGRRRTTTWTDEALLLSLNEGFTMVDLMDRMLVLDKDGKGKGRG